LVASLARIAKETVFTPVTANTRPPAAFREQNRIVAPSPQ
jgi:hypothetical protein